MTDHAFPTPTHSGVTAPTTETAHPLVHVFDLNDAGDLYRLEKASTTFHSVRLSSGVYFPALANSIS